MSLDIIVKLDTKVIEKMKLRMEKARKAFEKELNEALKEAGKGIVADVVCERKSVKPKRRK